MKTLFTTLLLLGRFYVQQLDWSGDGQPQPATPDLVQRQPVTTLTQAPLQEQQPGLEVIVEFRQA